MRLSEHAFYRSLVFCASTFLCLLSFQGPGFGQAKTAGNIDSFCEQLNEEYRQKAVDRDYEKIIKIYVILQRSFAAASALEQEKIVKTVQKGFRFASPPGAAEDFRRKGAECLTGMGTEGLKALRFSLEHGRIEYGDVDGLVSVLEEEYRNTAGRDEEKIAIVYDIFRFLYAKAGLREREKILKGFKRAFSTKTSRGEGEFKITAAGYLAEMDTQGLSALLKGLETHRNLKLSFPSKGWDKALRPLRDALYAEYDRRAGCDEEKVILIFRIFSEIFQHASSTERKSISAYILKGFRVLPLPVCDLCLLTGSECLAKMGKPGVDALKYLVKSESLESSWKVQESVIISLGRTKNTAVLKTLYQLLWNDTTPVVRAACKALSNFSDLPLKERKPIVENLVKVYAYLYSLANVKSQARVNGWKLYAVEEDMVLTLRKLTSQSFASAPQWQKWYNDNKGKAKW